MLWTHLGTAEVIKKTTTAELRKIPIQAYEGLLWVKYSQKFYSKSQLIPLKSPQML